MGIFGYYLMSFLRFLNNNFAFMNYGQISLIWGLLKKVNDKQTTKLTSQVRETPSQFELRWDMGWVEQYFKTIQWQLYNSVSV